MDLPSAEAQEQSRATVSRVAQLHLHRHDFVEQAEALRATNPVYRSGVAEINTFGLPGTVAQSPAFSGKLPGVSSMDA